MLRESRRSALGLEAPPPEEAEGTAEQEERGRPGNGCRLDLSLFAAGQPDARADGAIELYGHREPQRIVHSKGPAVMREAVRIVGASDVVEHLQEISRLNGRRGDAALTVVWVVEPAHRDLRSAKGPL